ncbi:MAG TPA: flagellar export chaperone FliS [Steroidobacteraceae bacterium]|jgi:flagellar protein FliS
MNAPYRNNVSAYQSVSAQGGTEAASPHRLVLMLMDGALERVHAARGFVAHGAAAEKSQLLHRATRIIETLRDSLDTAAGGEIAENLGRLYDYMCVQLVKANLTNRVELLDEVSNLLQSVRGAWQEITPRAPA